jgi:hypothetical protein
VGPLLGTTYLYRQKPGDKSKIDPDETIVFFDCNLGGTASEAYIKIEDFDISPGSISADLRLQLPLNELREPILESIEEYVQEIAEDIATELLREFGLSEDASDYQPSLDLTDEHTIPPEPSKRRRKHPVGDLDQTCHRQSKEATRSHHSAKRTVLEKISAAKTKCLSLWKSTKIQRSPFVFPLTPSTYKEHQIFGLLQLVYYRGRVHDVKAKARSRGIPINHAQLFIRPLLAMIESSSQPRAIR